MATLKDVAGYVGVSITTVSRVLNGQGSISKKTRDKVFEAMKELNYFPNEMARSLSNGNSHLIGLIVPYLNHPFFGTLAEAVSEACYKNDYKLMLCTSGSHPGKERELFSMLRANRVAGMVVCGRLDDATAYFDQRPLVSIERTIDGVPCVSCDNYKGGQLVARELKESGCRHVILIGNKTYGHLPAYLRYQGFYNACEELGLNYKKLYIGPEDLFGVNLPSIVEELLKTHPEIDGVFATSDVLASRIIHILKGKKKVPAQMKVVGFDGIDVSEYGDITTVVQPIEEMGKLAVELLLQCIGGGMVPERSILPVKLVRRGSSGPKK